MRKVINFGSLNLDIVYRVPHFVRPGETLSSRSRSVNFGGKGNNQSIALAWAGVPTCHAGVIGPDGLELKKNLEESGVDTRFLRVGETPTGQAFIQVDDHGQNSIILDPGANFDVSTADIDGVIDAIEPGDVLLLQNEINSIAEIMRRADRAGALVAFNFSPFDFDVAATLPLDCVRYLFVNETEGNGLTGKSLPAEILNVLHQRYSKMVVVLTAGSKGAYLVDESGIIAHSPCRPTTVVDTTSAGDTFTGYFLAGVLRKSKPDYAQCLDYANTASAITVSRPGATSSIPRCSEVNFEWRD